MAQATNPAPSAADVTFDRKVTKYQHPTYQLFAPIWRLLADVREGLGGFLDGTNLIPHTREWLDFKNDPPTLPTKKLKARRKLACYENFAATIIDAKKSALFRESPTRRLGDEDAKDQKPKPIQEWWANVDGCGRSMDAFIQDAWDAAGTFGHVYVYLDRAPRPAETAADAATPYLCLYTPLDVPDWLENDRGELTGVKFLEPAPRTGFEEPVKGGNYRYRIVTEEYWALYDSKGKLLEGGSEHGRHELGVLPVIRLYSQRRPLISSVGQSCLGDPQLYVDLYNLLSELRELLRNQTFSLLNIPLGTGQDAMTVEAAKAMVGEESGTENVIWSGHPAQFISASAENVAAYQEEIARRLRNIYRLAAVQWESDSKDAEAMGSLKLKREEMNTRLASYADEIEKAELVIAGLWYRAKHGKEDGPKRLVTDKLVVSYPDAFDVTPFEAVLEQAQAALSLGMPGTFLKELRKSLVGKFLPDLPASTMKKINEAIDAAPDDPTPADRLKMRTEAMAKSFPEKAPAAA